MEIVKWDRYFALYDQEELVCVAVYKKGAQEVRRRLEELKAMVEVKIIPKTQGEDFADYNMKGGELNESKV
jgi:hypothetical protein